jgi:hypothetical protein
MPTIATALWRRIDSPGHDSCRVEKQTTGWDLHGMAVFRHDTGPASIRYSLQCDLRWETLSGRVCGVVGERPIDYVVARQNGFWTLNGGAVLGLERIVDLDFDFTPATNFQLLRRISMARHETISLPVAWFKLESGTLTALSQTYTRRGERAFWYEAPSIGYAGLLEIAQNGFIRSYPNLWEAEELL